MQIDLSCPIELWHFQMPTPENPVCTLQLYNLTNKVVKSVQACFLCFNQDGEQLSRYVERVQGLTAPEHCAFEMSVSIDQGADAFDMGFIVEKVWFEDNTIWRRGANAPTEYEVPRPLSKERLTLLKEFAGDDATCFPSDQGDVWVCVCARPNGDTEETCRRCQRDKHKVFTSYNQAIIENELFKRQNAIEEKQRAERLEQLKIIKEKEEVERKKKRKRKIIVTSLSATVLSGALFYGTYFHFIPYYNYTNAQKMLKNAQYDHAKTEFLSLEDYKDSKTMVLECDYQAGKAALLAGTYTSLQAAQQVFSSLDYLDSQTLSKEAVYMQAEKRSASHEWANAKTLYAKIPQYKDANDKVLLCDYNLALTLKDNLEYEKAHEAFVQLASYKDADEQALECLYQPALLALDKQEPEKAIALFIQLEDYRESKIKLQEAYYMAGDLLHKEEKFELAADNFLKAGEYKDAFSRATQCLYDPAMLLMQEGKYQEAAQSFEKIIDFKDAKTQYDACLYKQAELLIEDKKYEEALVLLEKATSLEDAKELAKECYYQPGVALLQEGKIEEALQLLGKIKGYKDVDDLYDEIAYKKANEALQNANYTEAINLFTTLSTYEDSPSLLNKAKYDYALSLYNSNALEQAKELFVSLEDYEESKTYLSKIVLKNAQNLMDEKKYAEAEALLSPIQDFQDAKELYHESIYQQALLLLNGDNRLEGIEKLNTIKDYKNAPDLLQLNTYQEALKLKENGDIKTASQLFLSLNDYEDAQAQLSQCLDLYYKDTYQIALESYQNKDYKNVVSVLESLDLSVVNEKYAPLKDMFNESAYIYAEQLYEDKQPYVAYKYFKMLGDYKDVQDKKMQRLCYRLIGHYKNTKGDEFIFREDGTCSINGKELYYYGRQYLVQTGKTPDDMDTDYQIMTVNDDILSIKNKKTRRLYKMPRVKEEGNATD